jgi:hypothetical protein
MLNINTVQTSLGVDMSTPTTTIDTRGNLSGADSTVASPLPSSSSSSEEDDDEDDDEQGYDSEGLPLSPRQERIPIRPTGSPFRWSSNPHLQHRKKSTRQHTSKRKRHRHHGHFHRHENDRKAPLNSTAPPLSKQNQLFEATATATNKTFLTSAPNGRNGIDFTSGTSTGINAVFPVARSLGDDVHGFKNQKRLMGSQDHNVYHMNPLTRQKNQLWGRSARSSFFNSYHSLDKNVEHQPQYEQPEQQPSTSSKSPRRSINKDPFAEFTMETLTLLQPKPVVPLTTTEYTKLVANHMTTNTEEEDNAESRKQNLALAAKTGTNSTGVGKDHNDPRVVFLRECRAHQIPPVPIMDYHRMTKSKFRWNENALSDDVDAVTSPTMKNRRNSINGTNSRRRGGGNGGHRIGTAHMSSLEFNSYGLGDNRAVCYAKGLAVPLPPELSVKSLSLRNNRLSSVGACSILDAVQQIGTVTFLDLSDNQIGNKGARGLAALLSAASVGGGGGDSVAGATSGENKTTLLHCSVANNRLTDVGLSMVLKGAAASECLESFDLSGNRIGRTSAIELGSILSFNTDENMDGSSGVVDSVAVPIDYGQFKGTCLQKLSLSWCGLTLKNIYHLCQGLKSGTSNLLHLNLSHNNFGGSHESSGGGTSEGGTSGGASKGPISGDRTIEMLAQSIVHGGSVINVDLSFNSMNDNDGVMLLSMLLPESMTLQSVTSLEQDGDDKSRKSRKHSFHRLMLDGNKFGERTARQAFRAVVGAVATMTKHGKSGKSGKSDKTQPLVYLSIRECDFSTSHTMQHISSFTTPIPPPPPLTPTSTAPTSRICSVPPPLPQTVTLSSFDPQRPYGEYELDCRRPHQRCLANELALFGRLGGIHSWDCPRVQEIKTTTGAKDPKQKLPPAGNKKGKGIKKPKGKSIGTEWYDNADWSPLPNSIVTLNFMVTPSQQHGGGEEGAGEWYATGLDWSRQLVRWNTGLKTSSAFTNLRTRTRLAKTCLNESQWLHQDSS